MKKLLAYVLCMMLVVTSLVLPVSAAENIAAEDSSSYLPMTTWLPFNNAAITAETAATDDEGISLWDSTLSAETIVLYKKPFGLSVIDRTNAAYNYTGDGAVKIFPTASNYTDFAMKVDFTKNQVFDYVIASSYQNIYNTIATNGSAAYVGGATSLAGSVVSTTQKHGNSRYTLVVDSKAKTIQYYINGVWKYTSERYTEDSITLRLMVRAKSGANKPANYSTMYYYTEYTQADTPGFQIVGTPTATQAVIQFNQPVGLDSLDGITVGGNPVTSAADVSVDYDEPNVYQLTYAELANDAKYTIDASSIIPLYNRETSEGGGYDTGSVVNFGTQSFTLGVPPVGLAKRIRDAEGNIVYGEKLDLSIYGSAANASFTYDAANNEIAVTRVSEETTAASTNIPIQTQSLGVRQNERFIVEFDIIPSTKSVEYRGAYGNGFSMYNTTKFYDSTAVGTKGETYHYILDFTFNEDATGTVKQYKEGALLGTYDIAASANTNDRSRVTWRIGYLDGTTKISNISFYKPITSSFSGEAFTKEDGTVGSRYSQSLKLTGDEGETVTTATATLKNGGTPISVDLIKLDDTATEINHYVVDTTNLKKAGTYTVTVNPVAFDGTPGAPVTYDLTLEEDALTFTGFKIVDAPTNDGVGRVGARITPTNNRLGDLTFKLLVAEYQDINGVPNLVKVALQTKTVKSGQSGTQMTTYLNTSGGSGYYYKAFVWDNMDNALQLIDTPATYSTVE